MGERALLTESERETLTEGETERADIREQVRERIERFEEDVEILASAEPALFDRLQAAVDAVEGQPEREGDASGSVEESRTLGELDFPHDDENCKAAAYAARDFIRANDGATRQEIVSQVLPVHPLTFQVDEALRTIEAGEQYNGGWWTEIVRPGLEALPTVECPTGEDEEFRYVGEG